MPPPPSTARSFIVHPDARILGSTATAVEVAESVLYIAQLADAVGFALGAGRLTAVEVLGPASMYAALTTDSTQRVTVRGLVDPAAGATETLAAALEGATGQPSS